MVSETYSIEDCYKYIESEQTITSTTSTLTTHNVANTLSSLPSNFEMTWDMKTNNGGFCMGIGADNSTQYSATYIGRTYGNGIDQVRTYTYGASGSATTTQTSGGYNNYNDYHTHKIVKQGSTFKLYFEDTLLTTFDLSWWSNFSNFRIKAITWNSTTGYYKNLKIKPL